MRIGEELLLKETTEQIIGSFYAVYNELRYGFLESVYKKALCFELRSRGLRCEEEVLLRVNYKGHNVGEFRADLLVERKVIVEVKIASSIHPIHELQVVNYLKASRLEVGLILNFGPEAKFERYALSRLLRKSAGSAESARSASRRKDELPPRTTDATRNDR